MSLIEPHCDMRATVAVAYSRVCMYACVHVCGVWVYAMYVCMYCMYVM